MAVNLNLPSKQTGTPEQQLNGLYSYLYQLVEALNVSLNKDTSMKQSLQKAGGGTVGGSSSPLPDATAQEYQNIKALIVKTANEVTSNVRKIVSEMTQEYRAQSEFGTYEEYLNNKITQGADGFLFEWDGTESVISNVGNIGQYFAETDAYIKFGIVKHNDDGTFEAGMVVGKNFQKVTVDGKEYIRSEDVYALLTAEEISFWQSGVCFSRLSLTGLQASVAQLDKLITSVIESEGGDASLSLDGGLLSAIVKRMPVLKIHEGQLAQDTSLEDQGIRVYSDYVIMQGSGTPSPTNIIPINGKSAINMTRCGRNLFGGEEITVTQSKDFAPPTLLPPGTYTVSASVESTDTDSDIALFGFYRSESKAFTYARFKHDGTAQTFTLTFTEPISLIRLNASDTLSHGAGDTAVWRNVQLEYGDTKHDFEPYKADEFNVDFGGIRSGRFDWAAGILTEEGRCLNIDGTENWKQVSSGSTAYWYLTLGVVNYAVTTSAAKKCSHFGIADIRSSTTVVGYNIGNSTSANECRLSLRPGVSNVTDVASLKAYLAAQAAAGTPVQVAYQLTVPETVQFNACPVWAVEGFNTVIADGSSGRIEFGHDSLTQYLQSQIDVLPGKIELAVAGWTAGGVKAGSSIEITQDKVQINSKTTSISIPSEDTTDDGEIVTIDDEGLRTTVLTADEINSDSVVNIAKPATYTPKNAGEMQVILNNLNNHLLTGEIIINASAITGGSFELTGLVGGGKVRINNGTFNAFKISGCSLPVRFYNSAFSSSATAVTLWNTKAYFSTCTFNAATGLNMADGWSEVMLVSCTGTCTKLADVRYASVLHVIGSTVPYGTVTKASSGQVFSSLEFTDAPSAPSGDTVSTATLTTNNSRTWGGGWLSTSTFGTALYQGATGDGDLRMGCMWFDTSAISGKEIISATLTLRRVSGIGGGGSVKVGIYGTTTASASGTPAKGTLYAEISLANGAAGSVDITDAVKALANGTIKGLMIYDGNKNKFNGKTYTYGYCKLYGYGDGSGNEPTINVTYK